ncbi:AraC family transcriptional regulator [Rhizobium sp. XQZ8]|uniref:helix-turn-helix domain-containing protein n=1 Tax=Rhizobium populisoli TaxID=2859785 RepID=UPI001C66BFCF|nr:AraC family transcriptional regulator [Rhizobium populisoli]MBW6424226.1 AraC family transcriptional regulator [Rhizobium populisoli]
MQSDNAFRESFVSHFKADAITQLVTTGPKKARLLVSRVRRDTPGHGPAVRPAETDKTIGTTFAVLLQLREQAKRELHVDGKCVHRGSYAARTTSIVNHAEHPVANLMSPFDNLIFVVSQSALNEIAYERGCARVNELRCPLGGIYDETVWHLGNALLPALERPHEISAIYAEQVMLAANTYFAQTFGGLRPANEKLGMLAPWQLRRATEAIAGMSEEEVSLKDLASQCGLSVSYFVRAFKQSTGEPPYRWMLRHRVERSKSMLADSGASVAEIAILCGFADQSHFTRMFKAFVGVTPAAWRRTAKL